MYVCHMQLASHNCDRMISWCWHRGMKIKRKVSHWLEPLVPCGLQWGREFFRNAHSSALLLPQPLSCHQTRYVASTWLDLQTCPVLGLIVWVRDMMVSGRKRKKQTNQTKIHQCKHLIVKFCHVLKLLLQTTSLISFSRRWFLQSLLYWIQLLLGKKKEIGMNSVAPTRILAGFFGQSNTEYT